MQKPQKAKSQGQTALAELGLPQSEIADKLGVTQSIISKWMQGATPAYRQRKMLLSVFGIPLSAWESETTSDELPCQKQSASERLQNDMVDSKTFASMTAKERAALIVQWAHDEAVRVRGDGGLTPSQRLRSYQQICRMISTAAQLTGEAVGISEPRLLQTPAWKAVEAVIVTCLEPYPEALHAVRDGLAELASGGKRA